MWIIILLPLLIGFCLGNIFQILVRDYWGKNK